MTTTGRQLDPREADAATRMDVSIVWHYDELGLVTHSHEGYGDADLAELRRVRRLREDLELDHPAIEIILRMSRRIQTLQAEIRRLESVAPAARGSRGQPDWMEAEWDDLF